MQGVPWTTRSFGPNTESSEKKKDSKMWINSWKALSKKIVLYHHFAEKPFIFTLFPTSQVDTETTQLNFVFNFSHMTSNGKKIMISNGSFQTECLT